MKSDQREPKEKLSSPGPRVNRVRTFLNGFVVGAIMAGAVGWYFYQQARKHPEAQARFHQASTEAADAAAETLFQTSVALKAKLETLDLKPAQVKEEMARTGKLVRRRARDFAEHVADAAGDGRITAGILAKLAADPDLSVWKISVATSDGQVTLDGTVSSTDHVGKAVALAMEVDDVRDVTSNLKVETNNP